MIHDSFSTSIKLSNGKVDIDAHFNKKFATAIVFIDFHTTQHSLLSALLQQYATEKTLNIGVAMTTGIISIVTGESSVMMHVPESKITNNIHILFNYLMRTELPASIVKVYGGGDYDRLANDIRSFSVTVTGKCRNFIAALKNGTSKIIQMKAQLDACEPKARSAVPTTPVIETSVGKSITYDGSSDDAKLYMSIVLGDVPCKITTDRVTFLSPNGYDRYIEKMEWKKTFQAKAKAFLVQSGNVGAPAANDTDGEKAKAKAAIILENQNVLAMMVSRLRGFDYTFRSADALRAVDAKALACVKAAKKVIQ